MGHPTDALNFRTGLHEQLRSENFRTVLSDYVEFGKVQTESLDSHEHADMIRYPDAYGVRGLEAALSIAENFWVSADMCDLAARAAENFPSDEPLHRDDPPAVAGLMMFEKPFPTATLDGTPTMVHGMSWANTRGWLWVDRRDLNDHFNQEAAAAGQMEENVRRYGRYDITALSHWRWGHPMPTQVHITGMGDNRVHYLYDGETGKLETTLDREVTEAEMKTATLEKEKVNFYNFILCIWRLMQQTLADVGEETKHNKSALRYAIRAKVPLFGVTVINLRRIEHHYEPTGATINYRTVVRGHWRRVWCGPKDKPEEQYRRAVYVHPFIRGPEGAPLIIRKRVSALVR